MADNDDRDRSVNRPWWVDALDPVENLRALANVQDFGRIAAEELADRLLAGRDGDGAPPAPPRPTRSWTSSSVASRPRRSAPATPGPTSSTSSRAWWAS